MVPESYVQTSVPLSILVELIHAVQFIMQWGLKTLFILIVLRSYLYVSL